MPLVHIDMPRGKALEDRRIIADVIYDAMIATLKVPQNDRFQIISQREGDDLIIDPTYLDIQRSPDAPRVLGLGPRLITNSRRLPPGRLRRGN